MHSQFCQSSQEKNYQSLAAEEDGGVDLEYSDIGCRQRWFLGYLPFLAVLSNQNKKKRSTWRRKYSLRLLIMEKAKMHGKALEKICIPYISVHIILYDKLKHWNGKKETQITGGRKEGKQVITMLLRSNWLRETNVILQKLSSWGFCRIVGTMAVWLASYVMILRLESYSRCCIWMLAFFPV